MTTGDSKLDLPDTPKPPRVYPRLNRRLRIAMWLALIGGPLMIAMGGYEYHRTSKLKTEGATIPGVVVDSNTLDTGKGRTSYRITLDYKPPNDETTYRKEFFVTEVIYDKARQAGHVPVTYLQSDPTVSAAGDDIQVQTEPFAIGGGLIIFALAVRYYLRRQMQEVERYVSNAAEP
jgi:Protein of unknown function (DUF3592)